MTRRFTSLILLFFLARAAFPQGDGAVEHMRFFTSREHELSEKYMDYISQVTHGNRARKMEKRRQEVIGQIRQSLNEANRLCPYNGDASLREAYKKYWDILLKVFNEDYHKIVDMEAIAEQSYDQMEAYMLAQEKAGEVLSDAQDEIEPVFNAFAAKNNIRLVEAGETKLDKQLRQAAAVNTYYHRLYLIFFKTYKQEAYVMDALSRKDLNGLEQNRHTLLKFADEGLAKLDTVKAFKGDGSLATTCRKVLEFQKVEAEKQLTTISDFLLKNDEFEKMKKTFDAKPAGRRTQADIDAYNKAIGEFNTAMQSSNKLLTAMNTSREKVLQNWDATTKRFLELHVPKAR